MLKKFSSTDGFTLIELLVVILIIGILMAVAAPAFLGQQEKAKDSEMKQYLSIIYRAAKGEQVGNNGEYPATDPGGDNMVGNINAGEPPIPTTEVFEIIDGVQGDINGSGDNDNGDGDADVNVGCNECLADEDDAIASVDINEIGILKRDDSEYFDAYGRSRSGNLYRLSVDGAAHLNILEVD